ncbi:putative F-box protein At3g16210 [Gastrolobium bilobum]|uniref:putative F-box protein At3g16210 n=1 Tax=Gastrolobium bilobum TaxID=150636 RepID=UPI002AB01B02|nr:putative F-box protein At3g16210 [Gastrolobium bilobum]
MARDLDEDLELEILVRLPPKSLMRFKCVQRSWNALFRNHRFVMSHMNMLMSKEHLMVFEFYGHASLTCDDPSQPPLYLNCSSPNKSFNFHWSCGSSCNGVFCLGVFDEHDDYRLILWNPNTREVNLIPFDSHSQTSERYSEFYCFGFDPNTNDFKVVKLIRTGHYPPIISCAVVYNLSTNSWTFIHDLHHPIFSCRGSCYSDNVLVNGVYHWLTGVEGGFGYILCFDFCNYQLR